MFRRIWQQLAIATNWPVLLAAAVLVTIGTVSIYADSPDEGRKQMFFIAVGLAGMAVFQVVNYQIIGRFAWLFYGLSLALIGYTVAGSVIGGKSPLPFVRQVNGAYAWIFLGPVSLQPAELMKISFIMLLARYLRFRSTHRTFAGLIPPFILAGVPLLMILKQPDLGTAIVFVPVLFAMLFVAGARLLHLVGICALAIALGPIAWLSGTDLPVFRHMPQIVKNYQRERVQAMFSDDPKTLKDKGFQQQHALIALGSGQLAGKGLGNIPIGRRVPEAHNDMVFAIIGEQFGFFGSAVVIGAYLVLFTAGIEISASTREPFGKLVALGIVCLLAGQSFVNLMVTLRLMPVTGVTLPFVSYGGSSLLASFMSVGLLLNIGQNRPMVMARDAFEH